MRLTKRTQSTNHTLVSKSSIPILRKSNALLLLLPFVVVQVAALISILLDFVVVVDAVGAVGNDGIYFKK